MPSSPAKKKKLGRESARRIHPARNPAPAKASSGGLSLRARLALVALLVVAGVYFSRRGSEHSAPPSAAPAPGPSESSPIPAAWGKEVKLEKVAAFDAPAGIMDFYVSSQGDMVALTGASLGLYTEAGKLSITADIGPAPNRSLACDGRSIFVSNSDTPNVARFNMDLSPAGGFAVKGAGRLLGLAWSRKANSLLAGDVGGEFLYLLSADGKILGKHGLAEKGDAQGFVYDVAEGQGYAAVSDIYKGLITLVDLAGKTVFQIKDLGPSSTNRRLALLGGHMYVPCDAQGVVVAVDTQGGIKGYFTDKGAVFARGGDDGFLYVLAGGKILKYKPL